MDIISPEDLGSLQQFFEAIAKTGNLPLPQLKKIEIALDFHMANIRLTKTAAKFGTEKISKEEIKGLYDGGFLLVEDLDFMLSKGNINIDDMSFVLGKDLAQATKFGPVTDSELATALRRTNPNKPPAGFDLGQDLPGIGGAADEGVLGPNVRIPPPRGQEPPGSVKNIIGGNFKGVQLTDSELTTLRKGVEKGDLPERSIEAARDAGMMTPDEAAYALGKTNTLPGKAKFTQTKKKLETPGTKALKKQRAEKLEEDAFFKEGEEVANINRLNTDRLVDNDPFNAQELVRQIEAGGMEVGKMIDGADALLDTLARMLKRGTITDKKYNELVTRIANAAHKAQLDAGAGRFEPTFMDELLRATFGQSAEETASTLAGAGLARGVNAELER